MDTNDKNIQNSCNNITKKHDYKIEELERDINDCFINILTASTRLDMIKKILTENFDLNDNKILTILKLVDNVLSSVDYYIAPKHGKFVRKFYTDLK